MKDILSFYLDGTTVQAVRAAVSNGVLEVSDAATFRQDELESYLATCREKSCILCCNPTSFYQDIISLPLATAKYHDTLARTEMQKKHPDLGSFSFFYRPVGEKTIDGVLHSEIAIFCYDNELLSEYISPFYRKGITVSHIYAAPYPIFKLTASTLSTDSETARIVIAELPGEKLVLLSKNDEFEFIRKIGSSEPSLHPADIENINMTIDYCFQTLRVRPTEAVIFNPLEIAEDISTSIPIPIKAIHPEAFLSIPDDVAQNYIAPLAATLHFIKSPNECNIIPSDYASFLQNKRFFVMGTMLLGILLLILAGFTLYERTIISTQNSRITALRGHLSGHGDEVATYKQLDQEIGSLGNQVTFLNKINNALTPETALAALTPPLTSNYSFKGITFKQADNLINVHIDGTISTTGLKETQTVFEIVLEQIKKIPGYSIVSSSVDIKQKTFSLEASYTGNRR